MANSPIPMVQSRWSSSVPLAVERMISDGNRAGDVIQRLRALTKKTDPQNAPLDINDVINDVVGLVLPGV
jgi:hypothetical protein